VKVGAANCSRRVCSQHGLKASSDSYSALRLGDLSITRLLDDSGSYSNADITLTRATNYLTDASGHAASAFREASASR